MSSKRVNPAKILSLLTILILSISIVAQAKGGDNKTETPSPDAPLNKNTSMINSEVDIPMGGKIANLAGRLPLASTFRLKERILKLSQFFTSFKTSLNKDFKVKSPLDDVAMLILFIACSYLPSLIFVCLLGACGLKGGKQSSMNPAAFQFNVPEFGDIGIILKTVQDLQKEVQNLAANSGGNPQQRNAPVDALTQKQFNNGLSMLVKTNQDNMVVANGQVLDTIARMEQTMLQMMNRIENQEKVIASLQNGSVAPASQNKTAVNIPAKTPVQQVVPTLTLNNEQRVETKPQVINAPRGQKRPPTPKNTPGQIDVEEEEFYYDEEEEDSDKL